MEVSQGSRAKCSRGPEGHPLHGGRKIVCDRRFPFSGDDRGHKSTYFYCPTWRARPWEDLRMGRAAASKPPHSVLFLFLLLTLGRGEGLANRQRLLPEERLMLKKTNKIRVVLQNSERKMSCKCVFYICVCVYVILQNYILYNMYYCVYIYYICSSLFLCYRNNLFHIICLIYLYHII